MEMEGSNRVGGTEGEGGEREGKVKTLLKVD